MPRGLPKIESARLRLELPPPEDAARVLDYYVRNRAHLERWEPTRPADFFLLAWWERQLRHNREEFLNDNGLRTMISDRLDPTRRVLGVANLSNFVRGAFQACHLGYSIDKEREGTGMMTEALERLVRYAFEELGMHRVMANYQPHNERSARVLERLGFEREGFARSYLYIDGAWRDHVLTALVNPNR
jgi:ribosomal-protein-alanine N-acetyltransferase